MSKQLLIQKSTLTEIADAVRTKIGATGSIPVANLAFEIAENIITGETVVDRSIEKMIVEGTFSGVYDNPEITRIGQMVFYNKPSVTGVSLPNCATIGAQAFGYCAKLNTIDLPICTSLASSAFLYCSSVKSVNLPMCQTIGNSAFYRCGQLSSITLPACTSIGTGVFYYNFTLNTVNLPVCTHIGSNAFNDGRRLSSLTLGASTVCTLANSNAFTSTPYKGYSTYFSGTPWIYVPASLVSAYQSATNWTYYSSYFSAIPGTENEITLITFTIDGTEYQAEEGMTWGNWVNSSYNTNNYAINGPHIYILPNGSGGHAWFVAYNDIDVDTTENIVADRSYVTYDSGLGIGGDEMD